MEARMQQAETKMKYDKSKSIYNILRDEHTEVQGMFRQILDNHKWQKSTFQKIDEALTMHMQGEEKLFYPKLVNAEETRDEILEALEEHSAAKQMQKTIMDASDDDIKLAKVKVLSDMIEHHVDEEEKQLFKNAKKVLSKEDEMEIGKQFLSAKEDMKKKM